MGLTGSKNCKQTFINPDNLSVITLTDSMVQRLPLDPENDGPLEREAREQNTDDFWKDRLDCMENAYMNSLHLSENEFNKLEKRILRMAPPIFRPKCPQVIDDLKSCMVVFSDDPLKCEHVINEFLLCIDSTTQDETRKAYLEAERARKKQKCAN